MTTAQENRARTSLTTGASRFAGTLTPVGVVVVIATALGLGLRAYQLTRPGLLFGTPQYDDAVDFGSAVALVNGFLPYRDFAFVQPPGITLLLAPVAVLAKATGSDTGFAVARILTACVGAAGVTLTGLLVRRRGVLCATLVCAIVALHPDSIFAASTVFLEPWLVLFCLGGALAAFDGDRVSTSRARLAWGGVMFGLAGAVKVWAIFPAAVVLALCWRPKQSRRVAAYLSGVIAGFCVPTASFVAFAPRSFFDSVIVAQLSRVDVGRIPVPARLSSLFGLSGLSLGTDEVIAATAAMVAFVVVCSGCASLLTARAPPALESFALATSALLLGAFIWPDDYYTHYAGFFVPFLALSIVLPAMRLASAWGMTSTAKTWRSAPRTALPAAVVGCVILGIVVHDVRDEAGLRAPGPAVAIERRIPTGACVLTDDPALTIAADRYLSNLPACSPMVDPVGTDYALANGRNASAGAGRVTAVRAAWLAAFRHAQYVWLDCGPPRAARCGFTNRRVPWTPSIFAYFSEHFALAQAPALYVRRNG